MKWQAYFPIGVGASSFSSVHADDDANGTMTQINCCACFQQWVQVKNADELKEEFQLEMLI